MNRKAYRMIVLGTCVISLALGSLACDGGGDGCTTNSDGVLICDSYESFQDEIEPSVTDKAQQVIEQVNQTVSNEASAWVEQHSSGSWSRDCLSVWSQECESAGAYTK